MPILRWSSPAKLKHLEGWPALASMRSVMACALNWTSALKRTVSMPTSSVLTLRQALKGLGALHVVDVHHLRDSDRTRSFSLKGLYN